MKMVWSPAMYELTTLHARCTKAPSSKGIPVEVQRYRIPNSVSTCGSSSVCAKYLEIASCSCLRMFTPNDFFALTRGKS